MATKEVEVRSPATTYVHGSGDLSANATPRQFMKVTGDDEFAPQTDPTGVAAGVLLYSGVKGAKAAIAFGGGNDIWISEIDGSPTPGDEITSDADGFPTKYVASGVKRGLILNGDADSGFEVKLY